VKKVIIVIITALLLVGCGKGKGLTEDNFVVEEGKASASEKTEQVTKEGERPTGKGYSFTYQEVAIPMNTEAASIVEALGEPVNYFEAASCAFQGLDKIYYYNSFELGTYPNAGKDYVSYVNLLDDTVTTDQGIFLGSSLTELKDAYGEDFTIEGSAYIYRLGDTKLTFIVEADEVKQITYSAVVEGLNN
jgi:uncharacterized lipoprotein YmbA